MPIEKVSLKEVEVPRIASINFPDLGVDNLLLTYLENPSKLTTTAKATALSKATATPAKKTKDVAVVVPHVPIVEKTKLEQTVVNLMQKQRDQQKPPRIETKPTPPSKPASVVDAIDVEQDVDDIEQEDEPTRHVSSSSKISQTAPPDRSYDPLPMSMTSSTKRVDVRSNAGSIASERRVSVDDHQNHRRNSSESSSEEDATEEDDGDDDDEEEDKYSTRSHVSKSSRHSERDGVKQPREAIVKVGLDNLANDEQRKDTSKHDNRDKYDDRKHDDRRDMYDDRRDRHDDRRDRYEKHDDRRDRYEKHDDRRDSHDKYDRDTNTRQPSKTPNIQYDAEQVESDEEDEHDYEDVDDNNNAASAAQAKITAEQQARAEAEETTEVLWNLKMMKKYQHFTTFPHYDECTPLSELKRIYKEVKREAILDENVNTSKQYMTMFWWGMEKVCTEYLSIDLSGFTAHETQQMHSYERVLAEIGERSYLNWSEGLPPEVKLLCMVGMHAVMFHIQKDTSTLTSVMKMFAGKTAPPQSQAQGEMRGPSKIF